MRPWTDARGPARAAPAVADEARRRDDVRSSSAGVRPRAVDRFAVAAALLAVAIGALVLVAWIVGFEPLKGIQPGWATMKTNTALGLALAGTSLLLLQHRGAHRSRRVFAARALAAVVTLLGLVTLAQDLLGFDLRIDEVLVDERRPSPATRAPNRMAPATALSFALLGLVLLRLGASRRRPGRFTGAVCLVVGGTSYLVLLGYLYGASYLFQIPSTTAMAVHTALAFLALSLAILSTRPSPRLVEVLVGPGTGGHLARRLLPAAVLIPVLLGLLRLGGERAGLYDTPFGTAALVAATSLLFGGAIWRSAAALDRLDREREDAMRRLQAEVRSRELGRRRLQAVLEVLPVGVFIADASGRLTEINEAAKAVWGEGAPLAGGIPDYGLYRAWWPRTGEPVRAEEWGMARALSRGEVAADEEVEIERFGGGRSTILNYAAPIRDPRGTIVGAVAVNVDITERKRAERSLRESEELIRTIAENSTHALVMMDAEGYGTYANRAWLQMTGLTAEAARSKPLHELVHHHHPDGRPFPRDECPIDRALPERTAVRGYEDRFFRSDGSSFPVVCSASPVVRDGRAVSTVLEVRDVTEEKAARAELLELKGELEERVRRRTAELAAANAELEAFSYSVSHDLRAPVRWVDAFSLALVEEYGDRLDDTARSYVGHIREAARRMAELIDALLRLSRITRAPLERAEVDLAATSREIASELAASDPGRRVEWAVADGLRCRADPRLVRVALDNLLRNAWKFTRTREVARIEVGASQLGGETVYFVRDNGVGFDMANAHKLFRTFERLHRAEEFEGTGVGLALVNRVVQRHGGRIWAEARRGEGAAFFFTLAPPRVLG